MGTPQKLFVKMFGISLSAEGLWAILAAVVIITLGLALIAFKHS
ncbi:hypothetical protein [Bradyrhizobium tunisiense]